MLTIGDKLLYMTKEEEIGIMELTRMSRVSEQIIMDILAGIKEPEISIVYKIVDSLCIYVHELRVDEKLYTVSVKKISLYS